MNCTVEYIENEKHKILIRKFTGDVTPKDLFSSWDYIVEQKLSKKEYKGIVSDYRTANLQIEEGICELHAKYFSDKIEIFKDIKMAQVIVSKKIMYPLLFQQEYSLIQTKAFSTIEAAMEWMLS